MIRPGPRRDDADSVDRSLPESIREWVRNDPTGGTATPGHLIHSMTAFLPAYAAVALVLPGSPAFRAAALVLAVLLALVDSYAFIALSRHPARRYRAEDPETARTARCTSTSASSRSAPTDIGKLDLPSDVAGGVTPTPGG
jgi:hypothetical protein